MKIRHVLLLLPLMIIQRVEFAQTISYDDFKNVVPSLQKEDWKTAFKTTGKLLKDTETDSSDLHSIVTFIHIFSAAGMVSNGDMSYDELQEAVNPYIGKFVITAAHPLGNPDQKGGLNQTYVTVNDTMMQAFTSATNANGTSIFCFEYSNLAAPPDMQTLKGKFVRTGGILTKVEYNPNRSNIWIMRLTIDQAFIRPAN